MTINPPRRRARFFKILVTVAVIGLFAYAAWMFGSALFQKGRKKPSRDDDIAPLTSAPETPE